MAAVGLLLTSVAACGSTSTGPVTGTHVAPLSGGRALVSWHGSAASYVVTVTGGGRTRTQRAAGWDAVVAGLTPGSSYRVQVTAAGTPDATPAGSVRALGPVLPGPVRAVSLAAVPGTGRVTAGWSPAEGGAGAEGWVLSVYEAGRVAGTATCAASCRQLGLDVEPGVPVAVTVAATNPVGRSAAVRSRTVQVARGCALACVDVVATRPGAPLAHVGDGLLHSPTTSPFAALLAPRWWRVAGTHGASPAVPLGEDELAARTPGVALTELLSDDWQATHHVPGTGYAEPPWADLPAYGTWVSGEVRTLEAVARAKGFTVRWWDVQNEPYGAGYFGPGPATAPAGAGGVGETAADLDAEWVTADRAIKAADPSAAVLGPAFASWDGGADLREFLDAAVLAGVRPDGLVWHDNGTAPEPGAYAPAGAPGQPDAVAAQVSAVRQMLAGRPSLGDPAILINEYGSPTTGSQPGWDVGWLGALEQSGAAEANRACYGTCFDGSADGLLTPGGTGALAGYWVYVFAAAMTGRVVPVTTSDAGVTGLAAVAPSGMVTALIGRHQGCLIVGPACPDAAPLAPTVRVAVPWSGQARVVTAGVPDVPGVLPAPVGTATVTRPVVDGRVTVPVPAVGDGGAVEIAVSRP